MAAKAERLSSAGPIAENGWHLALRVAAHGFTHIGQRSENQDRLVILDSSDGGESLLVVADGLGGHNGGSLAARLVVETAERFWGERNTGIDKETFLRSLGTECHRRINSIADPPRLDPRSTLVALLFHGTEAISVHAGDSRVMQISGNGLIKRTFDHSLGQLAVLRGTITEEQLATHPGQKRLFNHVGGELTPEFEITRWDLTEGRRFVVCSDGFWEIFPPEETTALFESQEPHRLAQSRFLDKLGRLERHDNTTAIFAEVAHTPSTLVYWLVLCALIIAGLAAVVLTREAEGISSAGEQHERSLVMLAGQATVESSREGESERRDDSRRETEGQPDGPLVPVERVELRLDRAMVSGDSVFEAVAEELSKAGRIGPQDTLEPTGQDSSLGSKRIIRFRQEHGGISVFATELVWRYIGCIYGILSVASFL